MDDLAERFEKLGIWTNGDVRAPHKPLLLLIALARLQNGEPRLASFEEIDPKLGELLIQFGPQRETIHTEYPFWRLRNDGIWEVPQAADDLAEYVSRRGTTKKALEITKKALRLKRATGGFTEAVFETLSKDQELTGRISQYLLDSHFPAAFHDSILDAVGMPWVQLRRQRDPKFRSEVLRAYRHRCAICGYDGRINNDDLGLDAAHIKWHAAGGDDSTDNALALCKLHHWAFDRGALGLDSENRILVSSNVHGSSRVDELLLQFSGGLLLRPHPGECLPSEANTAWHRREVFRPPELKFIGT